MSTNETRHEGQSARDLSFLEMQVIGLSVSGASSCTSDRPFPVNDRFPVNDKLGVQNSDSCCSKALIHGKQPNRLTRPNKIY